MAKVISLFNHKGGVSKTTTCFNLGWMLGVLGHRVLIADFDPQCNLTGMVLGHQGVEDLEGTYKSNPANNIKDALSPAFESKPKSIEGAECFNVPGNENLYLLPGHIGLAEYETTLGVAQELSGSLIALKNLPGAIRFLIDATAESLDIDFVLLDMSPSLGPINQNLLMVSDYFIIPLHPDYFSSMALSSLSKTLPKWKEWAVSAYNNKTLKEADYPFPLPRSKFIGTVVQKYRPRNGHPSSAFQKWVDQLKHGVEENLIPSLVSSDLLDLGKYQSLAGFYPSEPLLNVPDFNSLIAHSQENLVPVYALEAEMLGQKGAVWDQTAESMESFRKAFKDFALKVKMLAV